MPVIPVLLSALNVVSDLQLAKTAMSPVRSIPGSFVNNLVYCTNCTIVVRKSHNYRWFQCLTPWIPSETCNWQGQRCHLWGMHTQRHHQLIGPRKKSPEKLVPVHLVSLRLMNVMPRRFSKTPMSPAENSPKHRQRTKQKLSQRNVLPVTLVFDAPNFDSKSHVARTDMSTVKHARKNN